jgi:hypothetical protein
MLLEIVAFAADISGNFHPVGEPNSADLAQR